jgi:hypothetical protein
VRTRGRDHPLRAPRAGRRPPPPDCTPLSYAARQGWPRACGRQHLPLHCSDKRRPGSELSPPNRPPLLPRRSPLHGHSSSARRVNSHSSQSTENPAGRSPRRDFSRTSIAGHWSSAKLNISSPNRPSRAYKRAGPAPHPSPRTTPTKPPCLPSAQAPPPPTTITGRRLPPSIRLSGAPQLKVRSRIGCPRPPLRFAPLPGRRRAPGRRRPFPLARSASLSSSVLYREGGRKKMVVLPIPPALFPLHQNRPPLYSLTLFFQNRPYALN